jgi:hypothetical protein
MAAATSGCARGRAASASCSGKAVATSCSLRGAVAPSFDLGPLGPRSGPVGCTRWLSSVAPWCSQLRSCVGAPSLRA